MTIARAVASCGAAVALSLAAVPGALAAGSERAAAPVRGLDISSYQHAGAPIDWAKVATQGIRFVSIKASEGTYYLNPYYAADARAAAAAGLRVMPYVFANPGRSGARATADFAARAARTPRAADRLPLVVDLENDPYQRGTDCYGLGVPAMIAWIARFTGRADALTGQWPVIYTTAQWWRECTGSTRRFPRDPLWLAAFGGTAPTVPAPWQSWTFWQYDNAGSLPGIGQTDLDYYQPTDGLPALGSPAGRAPGGPSHKTAGKAPRKTAGKAPRKTAGKTVHKAARGKRPDRAEPGKAHKGGAKSGREGRSRPKRRVKAKIKPGKKGNKRSVAASRSYPGNR